MESAKVIKACEDVIKLIDETRKDKDAKNIIKVMQKARRTWYFKKYYPTYEQAIKILDASDLWGWRSERGWGDLKHAEKLLTLAKHGDPVTLNEEDCRVLFYMV